MTQPTTEKHRLRIALWILPYSLEILKALLKTGWNFGFNDKFEVKKTRFAKTTHHFHGGNSSKVRRDFRDFSSRIPF